MNPIDETVGHIDESELNEETEEFMGDYMDEEQQNKYNL